MNKFFFTIIGSASVFQIANAQSLSDAITKTENERFDLAGSEFRQLINKEATRGDNYFYYGENFYKNNKPDSALIMYKKGSDVQPTNGLNLVGIGKVLLLQNKVADANSNLFKAKTLAGKNASVLVELADAYINAPEASRNSTQAIALLDEALKYDSKNAEAHILKGDALLDLHPTEGGQAIKEYEEAQKLNPKSPKAVLRQGKLWSRSRNYQLALDKYKEAIKIDPTFAPAYVEIAELYHRANQDNNALDAIKKYLELNGNNVYAQGRYASFLFESKQYADAAKQIEGVQAKDTSDAYLYRLLGYSYDEMGNKTDTAAFTKGYKAINKFFQKTADKNFKYIAEDYKHKGSLLSKTGKDSLGVVELQKAIDLDPIKNCELYGEIGKIWMKAKKYDKAIVAYEKLPGCGKNLTGQNYYDLGRAYYYGPKDFIKSDTAFSKLIQSSPAYPLGYFWRGKANVQLDAKNEKWLAKPYYEKGLELVKPEERAANKANVIEACSYLGYYYVKLKDNEKAKPYWTIVKELDPNNEKATAFFKSLGGK
ncbi:MAG TPA: tetratricopeptide repeat protein [Bacteroidia bacterium]|nr:tetratricopeptide repeat protein [Bacteroidia bacterium]